MNLSQYHELWNCRLQAKNHVRFNCQLLFIFVLSCNQLAPQSIREVSSTSIPSSPCMWYYPFISNSYRPCNSPSLCTGWFKNKYIFFLSFFMLNVLKLHIIGLSPIVKAGPQADMILKPLQHTGSATSMDYPLTQVKRSDPSSESDRKCSR